MVISVAVFADDVSIKEVGRRRIRREAELGSLQGKQHASMQALEEERLRLENLCSRLAAIEHEAAGEVALVVSWAAERAQPEALRRQGSKDSA